MTKRRKAKEIIELGIRLAGLSETITFITDEEYLDESEQIECGYSKLDKAQYVNCEILE